MNDYSEQRPPGPDGDPADDLDARREPDDLGTSGEPDDLGTPGEPDDLDAVEVVDGIPGGIEVDQIEEVDGIAVLDDFRAIEPRRPSLLPVPVQAAAVAVSGFLAGLLTIVLWQRRRARRGGRPLTRRGVRREDPRTSVVASRSFLVDVHLLGGRD